MRQRRRIVRLVAAVLAVTQVTGCGSGWRRPEGVAPADAVTTWHPDSIRVVASGRGFKLHDPSVVGDSLVGRITVTRVHSIGVLRSDVARVRPKGLGAVLTLRDSSVLEITNLWERGDSLGGPSVPRRVWEPVVVPLSEVQWIELSALPGTGDGRRTAQLPLAAGQTVRVWIASADSTPAEPAALRGEVSRMTGDSLVMTANGEERRIALASVNRLDLFRGHGGNAGWGALIGVVVGAAVGAALGANSENDSYPAGAFMFLTVPAGVLAGGFLGLTVGAVSRTERWQTVPLPGQGQTPPP